LVQRIRFYQHCKKNNIKSLNVNNREIKVLNLFLLVIILLCVHMLLQGYIHSILQYHNSTVKYFLLLKTYLLFFEIINLWNIVIRIDPTWKGNIGKFYFLLFYCSLCIAIFLLHFVTLFNSLFFLYWAIINNVWIGKNEQKREFFSNVVF